MSLTTRWAMVVLVAGVLVGFIMSLPASLFLPSNLRGQVDVYGSVFDGQALVSKPVKARVSWELERLSLLWLHVQGPFLIKGDGLNISGKLSFRSGTLRLEQVEAKIEAAPLRRKLQQEGVVFRKPITASLDHVAILVDSYTLQSVSGTLFWPGGPAQVLDPAGKPIRLDIPPLQGIVSTSPEGVKLVVSEDKGLTAARFLLDHDGVVTEIVLKRVQTWANVAFNGSSDEILFKRQRRLYGRQ